MGRQRTSADLLAADQARSERAAAFSALREKRSSSSGFKYPDPWLLDAIGGGATSSGARVGEHTALTESSVSACVTLLSDMLGMLPCKLYQKTASGAEIETDHPASDVVTISPDGHRTPFEYRRLVQTGVGLGGNGYSRIVRYNSGISAVNWVKPCDVQPQQLADGSIVYRIQGDTTPRLRRDVFHVTALSTDGIKGLSPVAMMREDIGLALTQREQAGKMYANGARFPGILTAPAGLTKEQMADARAEWQKHQAGTANAGKTPVLHGGFDYKAMQGMSLKDAEFLESRSFGVEVVARYYRIPLFLLQSTQKATTWGSGLEQMMQAFLSVSLNPWLVNWEQALGASLLTTDEIKSGLYFKFNRRALLQVALEAQAKFLREMRDVGVYSVNDCRRYLEENDLPDNIGDDYRLPFNGSGGRAEPTLAERQPQEQEEAQ